MKSNFYLKSLLRRISKVLLLSRLRDCVEPDRNTFCLTHNRVDPFLLFGRIELNSENSEARCQKVREEELKVELKALAINGKKKLLQVLVINFTIDLNQTLLINS